MLKHLKFLASLLASLVFLTGCQTPPQTSALLRDPPAIPKQYVIKQVPFYPQQQYYCGPTTLAEVANYHGLKFNPEDIAPLTFVPGLEGSLQIEMVAATRQLGMVAYAQRGSMTLLLSLLEQNIPVVVLQNNSIPLLPQWHYAVVTGYDLTRQQVVMHSGVTKDHRLNFSTFERTWQRGKYWMLAMLPPSKTSEHLDSFVYTKACQDLLDTGHEKEGVQALKSAIKQWPEYWLGYFLLANQYIESAPQIAVNWYQQGYQYGKTEVAYLNNYAYALGQIHCYAKAKTMVELALDVAPKDVNALDTQRQLEKLIQQQDEPACSLLAASK